MHSRSFAAFPCRLQARYVRLAATNAPCPSWAARCCTRCSWLQPMVNGRPCSGAVRIETPPETVSQTIWALPGSCLCGASPGIWLRLHNPAIADIASCARAVEREDDDRAGDSRRPARRRRGAKVGRRLALLL
jgi:hypothetical protein